MKKLYTALGAIEVLDPESVSYALDVVSVIEATLDDPRPLLGAQEHLARGEIGAVELMNYLPTGRHFHVYINPERDMPAEALAAVAG